MSLTWLLVLFSAMTGFQPQQQPGDDSPGLVQIAVARGIKPIMTGSEGVFLYTFTREGQRRESVVLTAGATFEIEVANARLHRCVSLMAAMPFNLGDGALLKIALRDGIRPGANLQVFLDPTHTRAHRGWVPVRLEVPAGQDQVRLLFEVSAGTRGDYTADWIGLAAGAESGCLLSAPQAALF